MGIVRLLSTFLLAATVGAAPALGADFAAAAYDASRDEIVVYIDYRGTSGEHRFALDWGPCSESPGADGRYSAVARVIDTLGRDAARQPYRVQARFSLAPLKCRPARVTLRMGRVAHAGVDVPARPARR